MEASHLSFLLNVLTHVDEFKVDWQTVATENGISRKDNCTTKFKGMMKKYGLDFSNNKFVTIEGFEGIVAAGVATAPSTPKTAKTKSPRKRKADGDADASGDVNGVGSPSPSPSLKKSKGKVKKEVVAEEVGAGEALKREDKDEDGA